MYAMAWFLGALLSLACPGALALQAGGGFGGQSLEASKGALAADKRAHEVRRSARGKPQRKKEKSKEQRKREAYRKQHLLERRAFAARNAKINASSNASNTSLLQRHKQTGLFPLTWLLLGPFRYMEAGTDPLRAFGGIWDVVERIPPTLWSEVREREKQYSLESQRHQMLWASQGQRSNRSYAVEYAETHQLSSETQRKLEFFPTEFGPGGRTVWALGYTDSYEPMVLVNFTDTVNNLEMTYNASSVGTWYGGGWAVGEITVPVDTTVLVKCTDWFHLESGAQTVQLPDIYDDFRAVHSVHLTQGTHRLFVNFRQRYFWCDVYKDDAEGRGNVTDIQDASGGKSPFVQVKGHTISDVVAGNLASPHLGIPILNTAAEPLHISHVEVLNSPDNLTVSTTDNASIPAGTVRILPLLLGQHGRIKCARNSDGGDATLNLSVAIHPSNNAPPAIATMLARCIRRPDRGYLVAYPDFDRSIQVLWAAPPNITRFKDKKCPPAGCPVLLSLHGADVELGTNWGRNYEYDGAESERGKGFPYPAWLVEPSNRGKFGSDWEDQGFDNALSALKFVQDFLPGAPGSHETYKLDSDRILITGHSMGGHGCLLFATHFPDSIVAAACGAGWSSMESYTGLANSKLINGTRRGLTEEKRVEHSADYLSSNLRGTPMLLIYGSRDNNVPPTESRYMARLITSASANQTAVKVSELDGTEHWFVQDVPELTNFLEEHLKPPANESLSVPTPLFPETFDFTVTHPATFGTKGFLQLLRQTDPSKSAKFFVQRCPQASMNPVCNVSLALVSTGASRRGHGNENEDEFDEHDDEIDGDTLWDVETVNVEHFSINMPQNTWEGQARPEALRVDGTVFLRHEFKSPRQHFCRLKRDVASVNLPTWGICNTPDFKLAAIGQRAGTALRAGPLHMVLRQAPVCIVHGSGDGQMEEAKALAFKMYYVSRYATPVVDGSPGSTKDSSWAESECKHANLILIGSPATNAWTQRHRCSFPYVRFSAGAGGDFVLGGNPYSLNGTSLLAVGGLGNGRLAMLIHGIGRAGLAQATFAVPVASGKDDADYFVFGPDYGWKGAGGILASGSLDSKLQIDPVASWAEPQHSVAARTTLSQGPLELVEANCTGFVKDLLADVPPVEVQGSERAGAGRVAQGLALPLALASALLAWH